MHRRYIFLCCCHHCMNVAVMQSNTYLCWLVIMSDLSGSFSLKLMAVPSRESDWSTPLSVTSPVHSFRPKFYSKHSVLRHLEYMKFIKVYYLKMLSFAKIMLHHSKKKFVSWYVVPCILVGIYVCFRGTMCLRKWTAD